MDTKIASIVIAVLLISAALLSVYVNLSKK
jgi:hypothetical protein